MATIKYLDLARLTNTKDIEELRDRAADRQNVLLKIGRATGEVDDSNKSIYGVRGLTIRFNLQIM